MVGYWNQIKYCSDTVDGRNPAPAGMYYNPVNNGIQCQPQLVCRISSINSISKCPNVGIQHVITLPPKSPRIGRHGPLILRKKTRVLPGATRWRKSRKGPTPRRGRGCHQPIKWLIRFGWMKNHERWLNLTRWFKSIHEGDSIWPGWMKIMKGKSVWWMNFSKTILPGDS